MAPEELQANTSRHSPAPAKCSEAEVEKNRIVFPHAMPFQLFFEEILARRSDELILQVRTLFDVAPGAEKIWLAAEIARSTYAYRELWQSKGMDANNKVLYSNADEARCEKADANLLKLLHTLQTSALCFSGGGIRSASFCLGVLQALSRFGFKDEGEGAAPPRHMLCELDYLSTVSGGGYIGSWLMAWTKRLTDQDPNADPVAQAVPSEAQKKAGAYAFREVLASLAGRAPHTTGDPAPRAIRHLRDYTSFLAPRFGLTLDTWTLAAIVSRNLFVNWVMILPLLLCLIAFTQVLHFGMFQIGAQLVGKDGFHIAFGIATLSFLFAGTMAGLRMPSRQAEKLFASKLEPKAVFGLFVLPLAFSSVLLMAIWLQMRGLWMFHPLRLIAWFFASGWLSFATVSVVRTRSTRKLNPEYPRWRRYLVGVVAAAMAAGALAVTLFALGFSAPSWLPIAPTEPIWHGHRHHWHANHPSSPVRVHVAPPPPAAAAPGPPSEPRPEVQNLLPGKDADYFVLFGFPLVWGLLMIASSLFSAFLSDFEDDIDREWWGRAGGMMLYTLVFWTVSMAIVICGPLIIATPHQLGTFSLGKFSTAGLVAGILGALGGFSTSSGQPGSTGKKADIGVIGKFLGRFGLVLPAICGLALLALALLLAKFEVYLAAAVHDELLAWGLAGFTAGDRSLKGHACVCAIAGIVALLANAAININIFSLHGMYKMRLMRAFLGSSNTRREPDQFTGFDDRDLVWESDVPCEPGVPLHLIHTTVNLVGTRDLAWAQRKAEGFTISPLHCGGWRVGYVPTRCYGGPRGISLATAMAISGAAINPNMGYHSSPLVTLIMTLFNARLGWWLPNPKYHRKAWKTKWAGRFCPPMRDLMAQKSPRLALRPLIDEMFGGTNDTTPYIELTDGGHFENLGVYEMVLRRSNRIIVVDAGADPECQFEDLGNAIRKIEIDLGIPITFRGNKLQMQKGPQAGNLRCAIADIHYECVDGAASSAPGILIYIKAGMNGQEPPDVRQYALTHPTFPHESTSNQFFTESQFESYRHLGSFSVDQILSAPDNKISAGIPKPLPPANMEAFFARAENYASSADAGKAISAP